MATTGETETRRPADFSWPSPETDQCPYHFYKALRTEAPVYHYTEPSLWGDDMYLVSRWEDITYVQTHPEIFEQFLGDHAPMYTKASGPAFPDAPRAKYTPYPTFYTDGPEHKVKRGWLLEMVARDRLKVAAAEIEGFADELIDQFIDRGEADFCREFAEMLPGYAICHMLGLPRDEMLEWHFYSRRRLAGELTPEEHSKLRAKTHGDVFVYAEKIVNERFKHPGPDALSGVITAQVEQDGGIDLNYLVVMTANLMIAGANSSVRMLETLMLQLCRNPDVMRRVTEDHSLIRPALEEALRFDAPVQILPRIARIDTEVGGTPIPAGSVLCLVYGSGNRDPEKFEDPDVFSIDRPRVAKDHLAFGRGIHLCVGAPLARTEGEMGFRRLLTRLSNIQLDESRSDIRYIAGEHRGPHKLLITFDKAE
jgi:cytochrome P450